MTTDEKIDLLLNKYFRSGNPKLFFGLYEDLWGESPDGTDRLLRDEMYENNLIDSIDLENFIFEITPFGRKINEKGGWLIHLDLKKEEELKQKERDNIELELAKSNIEANKLNNRVAKRNKRVTIINIIIGVINIIAVLTTIWLTFVKE